MHFFFAESRVHCQDPFFKLLYHGIFLHAYILIELQGSLRYRLLEQRTSLTLVLPTSWLLLETITGEPNHADSFYEAVLLLAVNSPTCRNSPSTHFRAVNSLNLHEEFINGARKC